MENFTPIIKYLFTALIVGGGLWKGLEAFSKLLEAVSNANKLRAEAAIERRRLEDEQIKTSYLKTLDLLNIQSDRIESLVNDLEELDQKCSQREDSFRDRVAELEGKVQFLKGDYDKLLSQYESLIKDHQSLKTDYENLSESYKIVRATNDSLRRRIRKLEAKPGNGVQNESSSLDH